MSTSVDLESLVGERILTGAEYGSVRLKNEYQDEDADTIAFILDGVAYLAIEDPVDGYRSSLHSVEIIAVESVKNVFESVRVVCSWVEKGEYDGEDEVLRAIDVVTGKIVFEVGTKNVADYYPSFHASFTPENMALNAT